MFKSISEFFQNEIGKSGQTGIDETRRTRVATCALLLELAWADDDFSDEERKTVESTMRDRFAMDTEQVTELIRLAAAERKQSTDLYQFTALIREHFTKPETLGVVEALWRVVYSDGLLEAHEDAMMHKIGKLLGLDHRELIALKLRARDQA
jgi:uncharacterized tellurite resistance protein B-like protein